MVKELPSLPMEFRSQGYVAAGAGKVFHGSAADHWDRSLPVEQYAPAFARSREEFQPPSYDPDWASPYDGEPIGDGVGRGFGLGSQIDFGPSGAAVEPDSVTADWTIEQLKAGFAAPFFLAYGSYIPHLPWRVPQRFFDLHPLDSVQVPEVRSDDLEDLPDAALEMIDKQRILVTLQDNDILRHAVQGYLAAISYADFEIGRVLDALASSPYADTTVIALWSDHGFHLGEKLHIRKFALWERATRVPLLLHVPGRFASPQTFDPPVSLIDLGPTLADACGFELRPEHRGRSLLPLVESPDSADGRPAVMTWLDGNHAVRRGDWRYIRYADGSTELYDRATDPDEFANLSGDDAFGDVIAELDAFLPAGP